MKEQDNKGKVPDTKGTPTTPAAPEKSSSIQGNDNTGATQEQKEKGELNSAKTNGIVGELQATQDKKELDSATSIDQVPAVKEAVEGRKTSESKPQFKSSVTADGVMDEQVEHYLSEEEQGETGLFEEGYRQFECKVVASTFGGITLSYNYKENNWRIHIYFTGFAPDPFLDIVKERQARSIYDQLFKALYQTPQSE